MLHARFTRCVHVPHHTGSVIDTDEAILAAFATHPHPPNAATALWQARRGGHHFMWCIWDGETFTGEMLISEYACHQRIPLLATERATPGIDVAAVE